MAAGTSEEHVEDPHLRAYAGSAARETFDGSKSGDVVFTPLYVAEAHDRLSGRGVSLNLYAGAGAAINGRNGSGDSAEMGRLSGGS